MDNHESTEEIEEAAGWGEVHEKLLSLEVNLPTEVTEVPELANVEAGWGDVFLSVEWASRQFVEASVVRWVQDWRVPELPPSQEFFLKARVLFAQTICCSMQQPLTTPKGEIRQGASTMNLEQTLLWLLIPVWNRNGLHEWTRISKGFHCFLTDKSVTKTATR